MKPAEFSQHLNQQATSSPSLHCLVDQIQVQKPIYVANWDYISYLKSKGLSDESIKSPAASNKSLAQALNYIHTK